MNNKKFIAAVAAGALALGCTIGGTVAWLTAKTTTITNTFTVGDINIGLTEPNAPADYDFDFVPGDKLAKDPTVTVTANSEACYLFVKVTDANNTFANSTEKIINWAVAESDDAWKPVTGHDGYWYRVVSAADAKDGASYPVFTDTAIPDDKADDGSAIKGSVTVSTKVTKEMVATINAAATKPTIKVTAAAVQKDNVGDVTAAFAALPDDFKA